MKNSIIRWNLWRRGRIKARN